MSIVEALRGELIVSCQAEAGFPLNTPGHLAAMAATAARGGAGAIRASDPDNIRAIRDAVELPIIGICKRDYPGYAVRITPTRHEVEDIADSGCDIIALDATDRPRPNGETLPDLIRFIHEVCGLAVMADISTFEEGVAAAAAGADLVATTLSGYTDASRNSPGPQTTAPDLVLVRKLARRLAVPVVCEGHVSTPQEANAALLAGAYAVVVGSAITRPHLITEGFANAVRGQRQPVIAIDIGGTKIAAALVDGDNQLHELTRLHTETARGGPAILEQVVGITSNMVANHDNAAAIGISTGGQIDASGEIVGATDMIPRWTGLPLKATVAEQCGLPASLLNDGHAAALAEAQLGAGSGYRSVLCVVIGTGLGGGLVVDARLQAGAHGLAGSVGQLVVRLNGGRYASLESVVSGPGLRTLYHDVASIRAADGEAVAHLALTGDEGARQIFRLAGQLLGLGLANALHICDADCVVVGGSVASAGDLLLEPARDAMAQYGHPGIARTPIVPAHFGSHAALVGAALFARQQLAGNRG